MFRVSHCPPELLRPALELVLRDLSPSAQAEIVTSLERTAALGLAPFAGLAIALERDELRGACWVQPQSGNAAALWLPVFNKTAPLAEHATVAQCALIAADEAEVALTQILLDDNGHEATALLTQLGFQRLANLAYLRWRVAERKDHSRAPQSPAIALESFDGLDWRRLEDLVAVTYLDSLDCPALDGMREMEEVLAGYAAIGDSGPELWSILRVGDQDAGVLLLAEHVESDQLELVYMGVTPAFRGRGIGGALIRYAQTVAEQRRVDSMVLAVDQQNLPARRQYEAAGFSAWANRVAFVRPKGGKF